jgi:hypothetical protein
LNGDKRLDFVGQDSSGLLVYENTTTPATCGYPDAAGVRICSPTQGPTFNSPTPIAASATGGALPIVAMKGYIDNQQVAASATNTLNASVLTSPGKHTLAVNAWDSNDKVYQSRTTFDTASNCHIPPKPGVDICSPTQGSTVNSPVLVRAEANGGAKKIVAMKAYIDSKRVIVSSNGTLSGSAAERPGVHKLTVNAWDASGKLYQARVTFTVR